MSIHAPHPREVTSLSIELERLRSKPLGSCPACREPVSFEDAYVLVNGRYVHSPCARAGVYEEVPAPRDADA